MVTREEFMDAVRNGVNFYEIPPNLQPEQIDPLIRDTVMSINQSGWVWTGESCQGHPEATEDVWASNVRPMLRLICKKKDTGRMLAFLMESLPYKKGEDMWDWWDVLGCEVWPHLHKEAPEWTEMLVYIKAQTAYERNLGLEGFARFARIVNEYSEDNLESR